MLLEYLLKPTRFCLALCLIQRIHTLLPKLRLWELSAVKKYKIEPLPTGYLIIGEGTTAWFVGRARGIPYTKSGIAIMYSLATQYLGMRFLYLEAGSGAIQNISPQMVASVRKHYEGILIIGGGIRTPETAMEIAKAGADIIVIGTIIERDGNWENILSSIINSIRRR